MLMRVPHSDVTLQALWSEIKKTNKQQHHIFCTYNFDKNRQIVFSRVFRRKNPVINLVLSGQAAWSWLTFWLTFLQIQFFWQSTQPTFFNFHTWFLQSLCFHVMPCSFQLVPNFLVKNAFFGDRYFFIFIFSQISVYIS